jgi:L-lactate dehydrogenase complex protein LldE
VHVGLFIPCYVDQLKPEVGLATVQLLEEQGIEFEFPTAQTCCGQPFLTAGALPQARLLAARFAEIFSPFDHIVTPSGSCAATMRRHLSHLVPGKDAERIARSTFELCEFLVEVAGVRELDGRIDARVGLHASSHPLRELGRGTPTEQRVDGKRDPALQLLESIDGVEVVELKRRDECCGFGGIFAIEEPAVSSRMGLDRLADHASSGAQVVTSTDVSCLLHLDGLGQRQGSPLRILHIAELLAERTKA